MGWRNAYAAAGQNLLSQGEPHQRGQTGRWLPAMLGTAQRARQPAPRVPGSPAGAPSTGMSGKGPGTVRVPLAWTPSGERITAAAGLRRRAGVAGLGKNEGFW